MEFDALRDTANRLTASLSVAIIENEQPEQVTLVLGELQQFVAGVMDALEALALRCQPDTPH